MSPITIRPLGCRPEATQDHSKCVYFEGGDHHPEVNSLSMQPDKWRLECESCTTVLHIFDSYGEAIKAGIEHAMDWTRWPPWWAEP